MNDELVIKTPKKKREYWTIDQENAVALYLTLDPETKEANDTFDNYIYEPLKKLVENIMFRYRLAIPDEDIEEQVSDTISFVISKFRKFDPSLGHKAFSYYGTISKNYMIAKLNKNHSGKIKKICIDDIIEMDFEALLYKESDGEIDYRANTFLFAIVAEDLENMMRNNMTLDLNVYKLSEVIVYLLRNYQNIHIHNKRQFYFIAREFTGMSAKDITKSLVKIKEVFSKSQKTAN